jgi:hypothetical protein
MLNIAKQLKPTSAGTFMAVVYSAKYQFYFLAYVVPVR